MTSESNDSGSYLERMVQAAFENQGYEARPYSLDQGNSDLFAPRLLIKNVPFRNLYDRQSRTEFVLIDENYGRKMRIECKSQETSGSIHEKLPYLYLNALRCMPEDEICFVYAGEWLTKHETGKAAIAWFERAAATGLFATDQRKRFHIVEINGIRRFAKQVAEGGP